MFKEWLGNRAIDVSGLYFKIKYPHHITSQAHGSLQEIRRYIKKGEKIPYSKGIGLLEGYETVVKGKENLEAIHGRFIIIANHFTDAPFGTYSMSMYIGSLAEDNRREKFRLVFGKRNCITSFFLEREVSSINGILVDSYAGNRELLRIIADEKSTSLGIYPEGKGGSKIRNAQPGFGHIAIVAANNNMPIIPIGNWYKGEEKSPGSFTFNIGEPIDPSEIKSIAARSVNQRDARKKVAEYCMRRIEELVPDALKEIQGNSVPQITVVSNSSEIQS